MIKQFMAATALLVVATANAEPNDACATNQLDDSQVTADIAVAVGKCHLASAVDGSNSVAALEYAHSWFLEAQRLGSSQARQDLKDVEQRLELAGRTNANRPEVVMRSDQALND